MGDIDLKVISAAENSSKIQKTRFWKEKSVENVVTREGLPFNWSMISFHIFGCSKNRYIHCKRVFTCWVSLLCYRFTLGPTTQATLVIMKGKEVSRTHNKRVWILFSISFLSLSEPILIRCGNLHWVDFRISI